MKFRDCSAAGAHIKCSRDPSASARRCVARLDPFGLHRLSRVSAKRTPGTALDCRIAPHTSSRLPGKARKTGTLHAWFQPSNSDLSTLEFPAHSRPEGFGDEFVILIQAKCQSDAGKCKIPEQQSCSNQHPLAWRRAECRAQS